MSSTPKKSSRRPRFYPTTSRQFNFKEWFNNFGRRTSRSLEETRQNMSSTDESKTDNVSSEDTDAKRVFKPKELQIRWQEESQYWSIPAGDGPAELLKVCWLDVSGVKNVTKGKAYEVSFMLSMNTKHSFGWEVPVTVMARIGKEGKYERKEIDLSKLSEEVKEFPPDKCRIEFKSDAQANNNEEKLYFGLYETWTNKWKGGLRIHEAIVQEIPAGNNASTSNTRSDEFRGTEIAA